MHVQLTPGQRDLLLHLVDVAVREIGPEIRHTSTRSYREDLKDQRRELRELHGVLVTARPEVTDPAPYDETPGGIVGTP